MGSPWPSQGRLWTGAHHGLRQLDSLPFPRGPCVCLVLHTYIPRSPLAYSTMGPGCTGEAYKHCVPPTVSAPHPTPVIGTQPPAHGLPVIPAPPPALHRSVGNAGGGGGGDTVVCSGPSHRAPLGAAPLHPMGSPQPTLWETTITGTIWIRTKMMWPNLEALPCTKCLLHFYGCYVPKCVHRFSACCLQCESGFVYKELIPKGETRKLHRQEHRLQRPTERSDPTQHAKGRPGDCPGPRKETTTRRNVTQGVWVGPTKGPLIQI